MEKDILVSLVSGPQANSRCERYVSADELGFDSQEEWEAAPHDEKTEAVERYFTGLGYPKYEY